MTRSINFLTLREKSTSIEVSKKNVDKIDVILPLGKLTNVS